MGRLFSVIFWLLMTLGGVTAQEGAKRALPQWLVGIIAVMVFLFLVFVAFLVNKAWFSNSKDEVKVESVAVNEYEMTNGDTYDDIINTVRSSDHENAYENLAADCPDDKRTAL